MFQRPLLVDRAADAHVAAHEEPNHRAHQVVGRAHGHAQICGDIARREVSRERSFPALRLLDELLGRAHAASSSPSITLTRDNVKWDWDSKSNPGRAGYWFELWVVVYTPPWSESGPQLNSPGAVLGTRTTGLGHLVTREEVDAIRGLLAQWKAAHSLVRAVVFTYDSVAVRSHGAELVAEWSPGSVERQRHLDSDFAREERPQLVVSILGT